MGEGPPARDLFPRVARGAASTLGATLVGRGLAMAQSVAVARLFDPHRLGLFAIVSYVLGLAGTLCDLGIPVAVMKLVAEYRVSHPGWVRPVVARLLAAILAVSLLVAGSMLGGAEALAGFYREPSLALLFRLGAVALVLAVLGGVRSAFLQGLQRIHALAALGALTAAAMLGFTLALAPWLGLAGIILASILTEAVVWGCTARILWTAAEEFRDARGPRVAPPATLPLLGRAFHIAAPSFLSALGVGVVAWALRSFLGQRLGFEAVGLYQVADAASRVLTLVSGAVAVPLVPAVAEMDAARSERLGAGLETILRATLVVTLPPALFLATGAGPLLTLVFGRTYAAAGPVASWLALAAMLQALWTVLWSAQVGTGRIWAGFAVAATGQALLLAGAVVLAPRWGLAGVGAAVAGSQAVSLALALGHVGRGLRTTFPGLGALAGVAGVGWAAVLMLGELGAHGVVSAAFLAAAAALGVATLLRPAERRLVVEILGPLLARGSRRG